MCPTYTVSRMFMDFGFAIFLISAGIGVLVMAIALARGKF